MGLCREALPAWRLHMEACLRSVQPGVPPTPPTWSLTGVTAGSQGDGGLKQECMPANASCAKVLSTLERSKRCPAPRPT